MTRSEAYVGLDFGAFKCDALELRAHLAAERVDEAVSRWTRSVVRLGSIRKMSPSGLPIDRP